VKEKIHGSQKGVAISNHCCELAEREEMKTTATTVMQINRW